MSPQRQGSWVAACGFLLLLFPLPTNAEPSRRSVDVKADDLRQDLESETLTASGNVTVTMDEIEMRGNRLEVDLKTNQAHLSGNVSLRAQGQRLEGEFVTIDMKTREWTAGEARVALDPEFFTQGVSEPLYANGHRFTGSADRVSADGATATSCDLDEPHYGFVAQEVSIYPEDKLVARNVKFRVGKTTIAQMPRYTISLKPRRRRQQLVPVVGYNEVEGAFAKSSYNYQATETALGVLYLDWMQKRGIGVGVEQEYSGEPFWGVAYLYGLRDKRTGSTETNARLQHHHMLSDEVEAQLNLDFTRNNAFYSRAASNLNAELSLQRDTDAGQSTFTVRQQRSSGFSKRTNTTASLRHRQQFSRSFSANLTSNFRKSDLGLGLVPDEELNTTLELTERGKRLDLLCRVEDRMDLDSDSYTGDNFLFAFERLPEIVAESDNERLGTGKLFGMFPVRVEASMGKFRELPNATSLTRTAFNADLRRYTKAVSPHTNLYVNGSFQQRLYSNNTAQYVVNHSSELDNDFARDWNLNLGYRKRKPHGFTPFRYDFSSRYESADARLSFDRDDRERFNLSTGYDFERGRYRDMIFRYQLMPNDTYYLSLSGGYDLENSEFRDLTVRTELQVREAFSLDLTTRYSPRLGELTRVNAQLFWQPHRWWQFEALSGWNGFRNEFDFNQFKITRDLHCWEAYVTWDQQRQEVRLDLALKAFPAFDTRFGVGQSGQLLNTSVGQVF